MIDLVRRGQTNVYGQVSVTLKGRSLKNELNYNRDTWAEWTKDPGVIGNATGLEFTNGETIQRAKCPTKLKASTKYGVLYYVASCDLDHSFILGESATPISTTLLLSKDLGNNKVVVTSASSFMVNRIRLYAELGNTQGKKIKIKDIRIFELPSGSEIESDFNTLTADQLAQKYPYINGDSVKSTNSVRVKSVGKNLFDGTFKKDTYIDVNGAFLTQVGTRTTNKIEVTSGKQYAISGGNRTTIRIEDIYGNKIFNEQSSDVPRTIIIPQNGKYLYVYYSSDGTHSNLQIEQSLTSTPYEPYTESTLYLPNVGELRSLPNGVKDEFNAVTGEKKQWVKPYVLQANDISIFNNTTYTNLDWVNIKKPIDFIGYNNQNEYATAMMLPPYKSHTGGTSDDSSHSNEFSCKFYATTFTLFFTKGTYADAAAAQAALAGLTLTYQLATPIVTQLDPMPITIFPNGSRWIDFGNKEIVEYADGIAISNTETPILELEKVDKLHIENGHWKRTSINLTDVTVVSDGLSLTIANAANGEIYEVEWDYDSALSTKPDLEVGEPSLITRNNRTIVL